jgi:lipoprotein-anchoring transpeptidase ErfK/SrfK
VLEGSIPVTDYYAILSRAVTALDPNTAEARAALFARARAMMLDRMRDGSSQWTDAEIATDVENFDSTVARIEAEQHRRDHAADSPRHRAAAPYPPPPAAAGPTPLGKTTRYALWGLGGAAVVLLGAITTHLLLSAPPPSRVEPDSGKKAPAKETAKQPAKQPGKPKETNKEARSRRITGLDLDEGELAPGIDGGSSDTGLPYFLRRQAVYYRTTYSDGMMLIDRSQRFLYLVQPQARAIRYGIGIGGECTINPGLHRITRKMEWPPWSPAPELQKRKTYPATVASGPGNPLGARVLFVETTAAIHGTNAPKSIGQALTLGCFRLINDDIVDLDKRVPVGAGVVVIN